jgi:hypothetical protein
MKVTVEILEQGDKVLGFSEGRLAILKSTGEVEIFTVENDADTGLPRIGNCSMLVTFGSSRKVSMQSSDSDIEVGTF